MPRCRSTRTQLRLINRRYDPKYIFPPITGLNVTTSYWWILRVLSGNEKDPELIRHLVTVIFVISNERKLQLIVKTNLQENYLTNKTE